MLKIIDEWQSKLIREHHALLKGEEEKKQKLMREKQRKKDEERARILRDVLVRLDELRALRAQNLELEGRPVPKTDSLHEVLKQYIKDHPLPQPEEPIPKAPSESEILPKPEVGEEIAVPPQPELPPYDPLAAVREFYDQANSSMDRLIEIRRQWDMFLVAPGFGTGTRIPPTFMTPPAPSRRWKKYVVKHKPPVDEQASNGAADHPAKDGDTTMQEATTVSVTS